MQNIADSFSNMLNPFNNAGWRELEVVSFAYQLLEQSTVKSYFQIHPGQSQMLLNNSERFALLLAENLETTGLSRTVESENISKTNHINCTQLTLKYFNMQ